MGEIQHTQKHENLVYDVGMHKGEDADYYLRKGFRVIGFEADPDLADHCRKRFSVEIANKKLIIIEGAIVALPPEKTKNQTTSFYRNKDISVWGTVVPDRAHLYERLGTSNETIEVPVVDFKGCLKKYGIPHYLKLDIEGMDTVCLRALLHFQQRPNYISIESDKVLFSNLLTEFDLLTKLGYTKFKAVQQSGISRQMEPNPCREGVYANYNFQEGSSGLFGADLPGKWLDYNQIINKYKFIFLRYKLFGDSGNLSDLFITTILIKALRKIQGTTMPGWYDTHAKHSSIIS